MTIKEKEIQKWINKNIEQHKWETTKMLQLYAKFKLSKLQDINEILKITQDLNINTHKFNINKISKLENAIKMNLSWKEYQNKYKNK